MTLFFAKPLYTTLRSSKEFPVLFDQPDNYETLSGFCGSCGSWLVSLEIFPQQRSCWPCRQLLYLTPFFISPLFLCLFNLEFQNLLLSVPSVLSCVLFCSLSFPSYSFLLFFLSTVLFSPSLYSFYFLISLIVFFLDLLSFLFSFPITLFCLLLPYTLLLFSLFSFY